MSFNIGLSALNAAQEEIAVTGNNIANASTNGFKSSRTEFADVYAASVLGGGGRQHGGGVAVQSIAQNFSQGNISFTDNTLDLAINGGGFFILRSSEGGNVYSRAGAFGTDKNGNIVNKMGEKLQGFAAQNGKATGGGPLTDLVVTTGEISPKATTLVSSVINLDAGATPSSIIGSKVTSNRGIAGVPQLGVRVAREAQIAGKISMDGTDFSGTTSARTIGTANIQSGLDFTTAGAHSFSISVNGGAYSTIDLAVVPPALAPVTAVEVRDHVQAQLDATITPGSVIASIENNRLVLSTAAEGGNSRINISAVQGLAAGVVSSVDVVGKTAPPTGFRITLDGVSRDIVIDKNFTNSSPAALALGGGPGSGNEALEDYIQAQIDTSAGLVDKIDVSIDNLGNIVFKAASTGEQNLKINPIINTSGSVNFNEIVEFSTSRRSGSLDIANLDFSGTNDTSFTLTIGNPDDPNLPAANTLQIVLTDDYSAGGAPSAGLDDYAESGLEALEDEIQRQVNVSGLPGKVKVSIGAGGQFVFEITDPTESSLHVRTDSVAASVSGGIDVSSGYDFTAPNAYTFNITYSTDGGVTPFTTANPIVLDQNYSAAELVPAVQALIDEEFGFTPNSREVLVSLDPLTGYLVLNTATTGPDTQLAVAVTGLTNPSVIGDTTALLPDPYAVGEGPGLDFASVATFVGSELSNSGVKSVANGYANETIDVLDNEGNKQRITIPEGASANAVAQLFSNVSGITAKATTVAYITDTNRGDPENKGAADSDVDPNLPLKFAINGQNFESQATNPVDRYTELATRINSSSGNLTARVVDTETGGKALEVTENNGLDLVFSGGTAGRGSITINSSVREPSTGLYSIAPNTPGTQLANLGNLSNDAVSVGGIVDFTLDEGVTMADARTTDTGADIPSTNASIFGNLGEADALTGEQFELNTFDPKDPNTYYRSTAVAVFDSLGNQHTLTQYFVKERTASDSPSGSLWSVYFQVDGKDIGYDPGSTDQTPSLAKASVRFNASGLYDTSQEPIYITNWTPLDAAGKPTGAGPVPGNTSVNDSTSNSNFRIDMSKLTQFGGDFAVKSNVQNGYASGQLTGLEIDTRGQIYARFSNGESTILGEVALADFEDPSKLQNIGGTRFAATAESGDGTPSGAGTAGLGVIQSGALEDSNVDLSEQLVQLIVSQRNFQAAAQIIESIDTATQTIINL